MNRHKRIAILVAPFLAIGGYIAADYFQQQQQSDKMPQLVAIGDCRPLEKNCRLQAGNIKLNITMDTLKQGAPLSFQLESSVPLDDVLIALTEGNNDAMPLRMESDQRGVLWRINLLPATPVNPKKLLLRLVVTYKDHNYFAELKLKS